MIKTKFYEGDKCVWVKECPKRLSTRERTKLVNWIQKEFKVIIDRIETQTVHMR